MELDPPLVLLASIAIAPTKLILDLVVSAAPSFDSRFKPPCAFLIALVVIGILQVYRGDVGADTAWAHLIAGDILAAFTTFQGALVVTEMHKLAADRKQEYRARLRVTNQIALTQFKNDHE